MTSQPRRSQWECLLQNLGEWQGSFTQFSPQGEQIEDLPTVVSFTGLNDNQTMRQIVRRLPPNQPIEEKVLEYSSLGRQILFFDNGAFSQGSIQLGPLAKFGVEQGLIDGSRRLRLVQLFDQSWRLEKITLIREKLAGTTATERPHLKVDDLVGTWQGEAVTIYPDLRSPDTYSTMLQISRNDTQLCQELTIKQGASQQRLSSTARIEGSRLYFEGTDNQVLLLPDGGSSTCLQQLRAGEGFFLELGWLLQTDLRQRMIRRYSAQGEWSSLTLVTERKLA